MEHLESHRLSKFLVLVSRHGSGTRRNSQQFAKIYNFLFDLLEIKSDRRIFDEMAHLRGTAETEVRFGSSW